MRFRQSAYRSAIHGTISSLNDYMQDTANARTTVFIKYLTLFQRETDVDLFCLSFENLGKKVQAVDDLAMKKLPIYRLTGVFLGKNLFFKDGVISEAEVITKFLGVACQHCRNGGERYHGGEE